MGATIEHQVVDIVAQCKLPASADATFHLIIADLLAGAATLQGRTKKEPRLGTRIVITALNRYGDNRVGLKSAALERSETRLGRMSRCQLQFSLPLHC